MMIDSNILRVALEAAVKSAEKNGFYPSAGTLELCRIAIKETEYQQRRKNVETAWKRKATQRAKAHKKKIRLGKRAWDQGWEASMKQRAPETCPYPVNSDARTWWEAAYKAAEPFRMEDANQ